MGGRAPAARAAWQRGWQEGQRAIWSPMILWPSLCRHAGVGSLGIVLVSWRPLPPFAPSPLHLASPPSHELVNRTSSSFPNPCTLTPYTPKPQTRLPLPPPPPPDRVVRGHHLLQTHARAAPPEGAPHAAESGAAKGGPGGGGGGAKRPAGGGGWGTIGVGGGGQGACCLLDALQGWVVHYAPPCASRAWQGTHWTAVTDHPSCDLAPSTCVATQPIRKLPAA